MDIEGIELPPDWKTMFEMLASGANLRILDPKLQHALKKAGYLEKCPWGRNTVIGTEKLKRWWEEHKDEAAPIYPQFQEWWDSCPAQYKLDPKNEIIAKESWLAAMRAGKPII